jgi:glucosyl-3-phosphoglycerate synthase
VALKSAGVIDEIIVADDSTDRTGEIAEADGADVYRQRDLKPEFGPVLGKGDAMWRALSVAQGDIVCFVDADSEDFGPRIPCGLIGAVALEGAQFVKGTFRRPFRTGTQTQHSGGGRVTELTAKPILRSVLPELLAFTQPLSGEIAGERQLLERLPFATFYAVDVALLIDVWREIGLTRMAEADLEVRQNRHRALDELSVMADQVVASILSRSTRIYPATDESPMNGPLDRPPLAPHRIDGTGRREPATVGGTRAA